MGVKKGTCCSLMVVLLVGCGYRFGSGGKLPGNPATVFVPVFRNLTEEPGIEAYYTEALRKELSHSGKEGGALSETRIDGEIISVSSNPAIHLVDKSGTQVLASYLVSVAVRISLFQGQKKLKQVEINNQEDFLAPQPDSQKELMVLSVEANRRAAIRRLAKYQMKEALRQLSN